MEQNNKRTERSEAEQKRHSEVIGNLVESAEEIRKDREDIIRLIIGLKNKYGSEDERVKKLYDELSEKEEEINRAAGIIQKHVDANSSIEKKRGIKEIDEEILKLQIDLKNIDLNIRDTAAILQDLLKKPIDPSKTAINDFKDNLNELLKDLEKKRMKLKEEIELFRQEKKLIKGDNSE